jgi:hypothetical protein
MSRSTLHPKFSTNGGSPSLDRTPLRKGLHLTLMSPPRQPFSVCSPLHIVVTMNDLIPRVTFSILVLECPFDPWPGSFLTSSYSNLFSELTLFHFPCLHECCNYYSFTGRSTKTTGVVIGGSLRPISLMGDESGCLGRSEELGQRHCEGVETMQLSTSLSPILYSVLCSSHPIVHTKETQHHPFVLE